MTYTTIIYQVVENSMGARKNLALLDIAATVGFYLTLQDAQNTVNSSSDPLGHAILAHLGYRPIVEDSKTFAILSEVDPGVWAVMDIAMDELSAIKLVKELRTSVYAGSKHKYEEITLTRLNPVDSFAVLDEE